MTQSEFATSSSTGTPDAPATPESPGAAAATGAPGATTAVQRELQRLSTPVDGVQVVGSLSPTRAGDFMTCPLLYRFRTVDRLPEPSSPEAVRGTVVHKVLEELFDLPAAERTATRAEALLEPAWRRILEESPELASLFAANATDTEAEAAAPTAGPGPGEAAGVEVAEWLSGARATLARYFTLEDPRRLEPAERELYVESVLDSRLLLRGFVDRLDVAPDGSVRIVDYKTGRAPGEGFEAKALFQLKFYALVVWRTRGVIPKMLQLIYLGSGEVLRYEPDEHDLMATARKVEAIWEAIRLAQDTGDWRASKGPLCAWCAHQSRCPEFGGTPPPLPGHATAAPGDRAAPAPA